MRDMIPDLLPDLPRFFFDGFGNVGRFTWHVCQILLFCSSDVLGKTDSCVPSLRCVLRIQPDVLLSQVACPEPDAFLVVTTF